MTAVGAARGTRKMPTLKAVTAYWIERCARDGLFVPDHDGVRPFCARCGMTAPVDPAGNTWKDGARYIERAHLIDRYYGGLDGTQNLAPLCWRCHGRMPSHGPSDGEDAIEWIVDYGPRRTPDEVWVFWTIAGMASAWGASRSFIDHVERIAWKELVRFGGGISWQLEDPKPKNILKAAA